MTRPRLVYVVTAPMSAKHLLRGQLAHMGRQGWEVHLICGEGPEAREAAEREGATLHEIPLAREISPVRDLRSLAHLVVLLSRLRPDAVNVSTPKAGLLGGLASWICRVPRRVYVIRGLRYQGAEGRQLALLRTMERITILTATHVVAVSTSVARRLRLDGLTVRAEVLGHGSSNGVDAERLLAESASTPVPDPITDIRRLHPDRQIVVFVGRLVRDKGIIELARAIERGGGRHHLVTVGPVEESLPRELLRLQELGLWHSAGYLSNVSPWMAASDVLALPSYREGFPNVVLEAAALGVPSVVSDVDGCVDTVVDGETGLYVRVADAADLLQGLNRLAAAPDWRRELGRNAQQRAMREFQPEAIWAGLDALYRKPGRARARGTMARESLLDPADHLGGDASDNGVGGDVPRDDGTGRDG